MTSKIAKSRFVLRSPLREIVVFFAVVLLSLVILIPSLDLLGFVDSEQLVSESIDQFVSTEGFESFDYQAVWDPQFNVITVREEMLFRINGDRVKGGFFRMLPAAFKSQYGTVEYEFRKFKASRKCIKTGELVKLPLSSSGFESAPTLRSLMVPLGTTGQVLEPGLYQYVLSYEIVNGFQETANGEKLFLWTINLEREFPYKKVRANLSLDSASSLSLSEKNFFPRATIIRRERDEVLVRDFQPLQIQPTFASNRSVSVAEAPFSLLSNDSLMMSFRFGVSS